MTEYYVQDLSKKVKSAKRIQMKKGENIVARAIYGYHKVVGESDINRNSKKSKGRWEPDEPAASVVRQIFQMALDGFSAPLKEKSHVKTLMTMARKGINLVFH